MLIRDFPLVSCVVPCFNENIEVLKESLNSLKNQSFTNFECILIDESTDQDVANACRQFCEDDPRFIYVHPIDRVGLAASLNIGIEKSKGVFIARFDSDDICMPNRLELQIAFLRAHPEISVVGGAMDIISTGGRLIAHRIYPQTPNKIASAMQLTNAIAHPTVMFRKEVIDCYGGYNPSYRYCEDLDLWLRWMNADLLFENLPQVLVQYRQDNTRRDHLNWRYNLRVRLSNFSSRHLIRRIIGITCIAAWVAVPGRLQEQIYKVFLLRRRDQVEVK
ncbi:glycosyltransferase [Polynucleobacter sp. 30F-ANTBAC]|uniref:glycosyltransferase n=1 Tax=Polynucleobacter sp. 30F-ANTBAC TaxID=2689095 RepID=UPI001C0E41E5|nr:glycosyltransferase [Polynucleobacter sp. 30F-ANTBAC]MBU3599652.1 glycosyltransferase [Polynucleobacter sp. 30F-ANTBAC]